jgi:hypothetical protein
MGDSRSEKVMAVLKEGTATAIAVAIVVAFLVTLRGTWSLLGNPEQLVAAKDLLQVLTGLLGVVAGYYFGRVPAERTADAARREAQASREVAAASRESAREMRRKATGEIERALEHLAPRASLGGGQAAAPDAAAAVLRELLAELESR